MVMTVHAKRTIIFALRMSGMVLPVVGLACYIVSSQMTKCAASGDYVGYIPHLYCNGELRLKSDLWVPDVSDVGYEPAPGAKTGTKTSDEEYLCAVNEEIFMRPPYMQTCILIATVPWGGMTLRCQVTTPDGDPCPHNQ